MYLYERVQNGRREEITKLLVKLSIKSRISPIDMHATPVCPGFFLLGLFFFCFVLFCFCFLFFLQGGLGFLEGLSNLRWSQNGLMLPNVSPQFFFNLQGGFNPKAPPWTCYCSKKPVLSGGDSLIKHIKWMYPYENGEHILSS